jgi:hypothetical protein
MAWSASRIFQQAMLNPIAGQVNAATKPTSFVSLTATSEVFVALYSSNTITPDATVAVASTGYNTGQWVTGGEASGTGYTAGGQALSTPGAVSFATDAATVSVCYHASPLAWTGSSFTAYGCLVYDNVISGGTVAKQGMCYNYFGGAQTVTSGTFTINWATVGATTAVFNLAV